MAAEVRKWRQWSTDGSSGVLMAARIVYGDGGVVMGAEYSTDGAPYIA